MVLNIALLLNFIHFESADAVNLSLIDNLFVHDQNIFISHLEYKDKAVGELMAKLSTHFSY